MFRIYKPCFYTCSKIIAQLTDKQFLGQVPWFFRDILRRHIKGLDSIPVVRLAFGLRSWENLSMCGVEASIRLKHLNPDISSSKQTQAQIEIR